MRIDDFEKGQASLLEASDLTHLLQYSLITQRFIVNNPRTWYSSKCSNRSVQH